MTTTTTPSDEAMNKISELEAQLNLAVEALEYIVDRDWAIGKSKQDAEFYDVARTALAEIKSVKVTE